MMLEAKEICKGFDGLGVLRGISLSIAQGEVMALIGPSGSGKSTLLRCLNQYWKPSTPARSRWMAKPCAP